MQPKRVYKVRNGVICGVCGGLGEYLNIDPVILRVVWALCSFSGVGLIAYFVCAAIIPYKDQI